MKTEILIDLPTEGGWGIQVEVEDPNPTWTINANKSSVVVYEVGFRGIHNDPNFPNSYQLVRHTLELESLGTTPIDMSWLTYAKYAAPTNADDCIYIGRIIKSYVKLPPVSRSEQEDMARAISSQQGNKPVLLVYLPTGGLVLKEERIIVDVPSDRPKGSGECTVQQAQPVRREDAVL